MKGWALLFTVLVSFFTSNATAEDNSPCTYVLKDVSFEYTKGLTPEQVEQLRAGLVGQCYDPVKSAPISQHVYDQLLEWGYSKATVDDPSGFRVLDFSVHPEPISVAIDFRLTGSDPRPK